MPGFPRLTLHVAPDLSQQLLRGAWSSEFLCFLFSLWFFALPFSLPQVPCTFCPSCTCSPSCCSLPAPKSMSRVAGGLPLWCQVWIGSALAPFGPWCRAILLLPNLRLSALLFPALQHHQCRTPVLSDAAVSSVLWSRSGLLVRRASRSSSCSARCSSSFSCASFPFCVLSSSSSMACKWGATDPFHCVPRREGFPVAISLPPVKMARARAWFAPSFASGSRFSLPPTSALRFVLEAHRLDPSGC